MITQCGSPRSSSLQQQTIPTLDTMSETSSPILVTGADSYVGAHVIVQLLSEGYTVRATSRNLSDPRLNILKKVAPDASNLSIVYLDLNDHQSFPPAVMGCSAVIHVATPVYFPLDDRVPFKTKEEAYEKQVNPAEVATVKLLEACKEANITRFILTGSIVSVLASSAGRRVLSANDWSDVEFLKEHILDTPHTAYTLAKTLQEKAAWEIANKLGIKLVTILPGYILGPGLFSGMSLSEEYALRMCKGGGCGTSLCKPNMIPDSTSELVDVRDVAIAHVNALKDEASGRYLLITASVLWKDIVDLMRTRAKVPEMEVDKKNGAIPMKLDNARMRELGVGDRPWSETMIDHAERLIEKGFMERA